MNEYKHDIYLSFTGADRELKNDICNRLTEAGFKDVYDSDAYCKGQFRQDYMEALSSSKVFLMILSDNLRNDPSITSQGTLTEVRKELALACELEARNELNIIILCMSEFFRYQNGFKNVRDTIGWLFYTHTRGFSYVTGGIDEDGLLKPQAYHGIETRARSFIEMRDAGTPVISQAQKLDISVEKLAKTELFVGRKREIKAVTDAYRDGKQAVVLSGIGGMGKSRLALEIARLCKDEFYFNCPQIIQISEQGGALGGLYAIASSANYVAELYDSLAYLSEHDKYKRKLKALTDLPENVLLVIDNYNSITTDQLDEILDSLKCRVLITTRSHIEVDSDRAEYLSIDKIEKDDARMLFSRLCGFEVDKDGFEGIYDETKGHTITLCIFAKMVKAHGLSIDELASKIKSIDTMEEMVSNRGRYDTIFGHLKGLFEVSGFDEPSLRILRSMSILANGTIQIKDLMQVLELKTRNEINALVRTGWLEMIKEPQECLFLHPIIASMMQKILLPSEENVPQMIAYIKNQVISQKQSLTYVSLDTVCNALYYAMDVLASSSGVLCRTLWEEYVELNHLIGDSDATTKNTNALSNKLSNSTDIAIVEAYGDMIVLELHPTRLDILDKYIRNLENDANNYKLIIRCLSTTIAYIISIPKFAPKLDKIIEKAINSAIIADDALALCSFLPYIFYVSKGKKGALIKKIKAYIKAHKGQVANGDVLLLMLTYNEYESLFKTSNSLGEAINGMASQLNSLGSGRYIIDLIRHPIKTIKRNKLFNKMEELEEYDPLTPFFKALISAFSDELELDILEYLNCIVLLHERQVQKGLTLLSASQMVENCLGFLNQMTLPIIQSGVEGLVQGIDLENISINEISRLQVAALISRAIKDEKAIERSEMVYRVIERVRPKGHTDVIQAKLTLADTCLELASDEQGIRLALGIYLELYNELKKNSEDSSFISKVALSILSFVERKMEIPNDIASDLYEIVKENDGMYSDTHLEAFYYYAYIIFKSMCTKKIQQGDPTVEYIKQSLIDMSQALKSFTYGKQARVIDSVYLCIAYLSPTANESLYNDMLHILSTLCPTHKKAKCIKNALLCKAQARRTVLTTTDNSIKVRAVLGVIDSYVKNKLYRQSIATELRSALLFTQGMINEDLKIMDVFSALLKGKRDKETACAEMTKIMLATNAELYFKYIDENEEYILSAGVIMNLKKELDAIIANEELFTESEYKKLKSGTECLKKSIFKLIDRIAQKGFVFPVKKQEAPPVPKPMLKISRPRTDGSSRAIGRNDPCPCGSGKKYKACCGKTEE